MYIVQTHLLCSIHVYMVYVLYFYAIFGTRHMSIECTFQVANHMCVYVVRKTKVEIRIHSENLVKTSIQKPKKIFYSTYPDLIDLKVVLKELRQTKNQKINSVQQTRRL